MHLEVAYGSGCLESNARKIFLTNLTHILEHTKGGKGLIFASEASHPVNQRSPCDVVTLAQLFGLKTNIARSTICDNPQLCFKHAHMRRTYEGVAEIVVAQESDSEEEINE